MIPGKRYKYVIFAILPVVLILLWRQSFRAQDVSTDSMASTAATVRHAGSTPPVQPLNPKPIDTVPVAPQSAGADGRPNQATLSSKFNNVKNLSASYAGFTEIADHDPEAQYFRARIIEICMLSSGPALERIEERVSKSTAAPGRMEIIAALKAGCRDVPVQSIKESGSALIREAAQRGDPKSKAYLFRFEPIGIGEKSTADTDLVRSLALSRDPDVINNLADYFGIRDQRLVWNIPGIEGPVSGAEMANAFRLTACTLGYDCSATSLDAQIACAYRGFCDGDRVSQIRNNLTTPAGFARVEQIRAAILASFSSGKWPAGFWSGIGTVR